MPTIAPTNKHECHQPRRVQAVVAGCSVPGGFRWISEDVQVLAAVVPVPGPATGWLAQLLDLDGTTLAEPQALESVADFEGFEASGVRWLWNSTEPVYQPLLAGGLRILRCHDIELTERILLGREGRSGSPSSAAAIHARLHGLPVPTDASPTFAGHHPMLFETATTTADPGQALALLREAYLDQQRRIGADNPLKLLTAAESASALAAVEMGHLGLPLRADVLEAILTEQLGPRPARLAALAADIDAAFGARVNADSAAGLREAFRRDGFDIETTRSWVIGQLDHPAVGPVLAYKELSRLFTANGWNWLSEWVQDGRFRGGYLPGGVVSGRWAARGGGALQLPRLVRRAVIADPGHVLVVADAAQLEPRVLAALSRDPALLAVSQEDDLYTALAHDGFGGDRAHAKVAMLGAMYGATSGEAGRLLGTLRRRYPVAMACVGDAARQGELGGVVSSVLGRTSPGPGPQWWAQLQAGSMPDASAAQERRARQIARDRGRFTRNFIVQSSAADWAGVWLSTLRRDLRLVPGAEMVFFQHDELVVHTPLDTAEEVAALTVAAAESARRLVFRGSPAAILVRPLTVTCYAEAK